MSCNGAWRLQGGLVKTALYKRKLALLPKICSDGTRVWFRFYYKKYEIWTHPASELDHSTGHKDYIESITEEEYIVRKLAETL